MADRLLIYGAAGFTGGLIVREALARGLRPVLAGRSRERLAPVAEREGLEARAASADDPRALGDVLRGIDVVVNAAGPFRSTALPLARACIERRAHYLDVSGEFAVTEALAALDRAARRRGVMILPSAGFDVIASDCMAALVARRLPRARSLDIALSGLDAISRGSAASVLAQYADLVMVRRGGALVRVPPGALTRQFDFGRGPSRSTAITWSDVSSAFRTTGIADITVYYEATPIVEMGLAMNRLFRLLPGPATSWVGAGIERLPAGPDDARRARGRATVVVEATDPAGRRASVRLHTPEVYSFTAATAALVADRALGGAAPAGFQTPALAYGAELAMSMPGVRFETLH